MRKRTKIQNLNQRIDAQTTIIKRLLGVLTVVNNAVVKLKASENWVTQEVHQEGCPRTKAGCYCPSRTDFIWNGETSPLKLVSGMEGAIKNLLSPAEHAANAGTDNSTEEVAEDSPTPAEAQAAG